MGELATLFWKFGLDYIGYTIVVVSILFSVNMMLKEPVREAVSDYRLKLKIKKNRENRTLDKHVNKFSESRLYKHIYYMVRTTSKTRSDSEVTLFFAYTAVLFITTFMILTVKAHDLVLGFIIAVSASIIPYFFLRIRVNKIRTAVGNEILVVLRSLSQNYSTVGNDIRRALLKTLDDIDSEDFKKVFYGLLTDMQSAKNEDEIRLAIDAFTYGLGGGSSWARRLGGVIRKSYIHKENVLETLLTLTRQIEATEEMLAQEKSKNLDTLMTGYGAIPSVAISVLLGKMISGGQNWYKLQFETPYALITLILAIVLSIISLALSILLINPKNDL